MTLFYSFTHITSRGCSIPATLPTKHLAYGAVEVSVMGVSPAHHRRLGLGTTLQPRKPGRPPGQRGELNGDATKWVPPTWSRGG